MKNRRISRWHWFWVAVALAAFVGEARLNAAPKSSDSAQPSTTSTIKELRRKAAERRRRIIFNNDGGDALKEMSEPTAKDLVDQRTTMLAGTQVDTLFYCTHSVGLDLFTHFTKIGTNLTTRDGHYDKNQMAELLRQGIDPLRVMLDFGKQQNIEVFWSMRMNDTHDASFHEEYGPILLKANRFKSAHPEYLLGTAKKRPKHGAWTALSYGRPEVRERVFQLVEEVCRNYDIGGINLDFLRHPVLFPSTARGEIATDEERAAMTELLTQIRKMADEVGQSRGRPILIAVRTPDSVDYCRAIGLDLERWLADDLFDLFLPSGYFQLNEWDYSVALGHKYGVKVYPSLDDSRVGDATDRVMRMTNLAYRARAADVWRAGADGVYLFNFPDFYKADNSVLRELGSPQSLARLDKDYFASVRGATKSSNGNLPFEPYLNVETLSPNNPRKIVAGKTATAKLYVGEDLERGTAADIKLRLKLRGLADADHIRVTVNGRTMKVKPGTRDWFESVLSHSDLRRGRNTIDVAVPAAQNRPVVWSDAVLEVRYAKGQ